MDLLGLALALNLPLSGGRFTGDYSLDLSPTFAVPGPTNLWGAAATTFPGVVLYDPKQRNTFEPWEETVRHEMRHVEQQQALGPAFWLAYAATGGKPFEPGAEFSFMPSSTGPNFGRDVKTTDYSQMWMPPDSMAGRHPLFRLASELQNGRRQTRLEFMPGYPRLLTIRPETERALLNLSKGVPRGSSKPPR